MKHNGFEKEDLQWKTIVNIPNFISMARIIASFPLAWLIYQAGFPMSYSLMVWTVIFLLTDFFDGYLARKLHQQTKMGQVLDPVGDKLLAFGLMGALLAHKLLPWWVLIIPIRDIIAIFIAKNYMNQANKVMKANNIARTKTFMLSIAMGACIILGEFTIISFITLLISCLLVFIEAILAIYNYANKKTVNDVSVLKQIVINELEKDMKKNTSEK